MGMKAFFNTISRLFAAASVISAAVLAVGLFHIPSIVYLVIFLFAKLKKISSRKAALFLLLAALIPIPYYYKDGGTQEFRAVLYNVALYDKINGVNYETGQINHLRGVGLYLFQVLPVYENTYTE